MHSSFGSHNKNACLLPQGYTPTISDILCGRGKATAQHPGNIIFMSLVRSSLKYYSDARSRTEKSVVVNSFVTNILDGGMRFLKVVDDGNTSRYMELSSDGAHDKVGRAIRDLLKQEKKKHKDKNKKSNGNRQNITRCENFKGGKRLGAIRPVVSRGLPTRAVRSILSGDTKYVATNEFAASNKNERKRPITYNLPRQTTMSEQREYHHQQQATMSRRKMLDHLVLGGHDDISCDEVGETSSNAMGGLQLMLSVLTENIICSSSSAANGGEEDGPLAIVPDDEPMFSTDFFENLDVPTKSIHENARQEQNDDIVDVVPLPLESNVDFQCLEVDGLSDAFGTNSKIMWENSF